jgi:signal peptidase I
MKAQKGEKRDFFDMIQGATEAVLTWRKRRRRLKQEKQKKKSALVDWLEAVIWAACVVLVINQYFFQAYQIPSGSMIDTLLIGDRIFVNKLVYGPELLPGAMKVASPVKPERNDIIIFESPEYLSRGTLFDIAQRIIYMVTLSYIDIDRDENGRPKAHFLIKRAVGMPGDRLFCDSGDMLMQFAGETRVVRETDYNEERGWAHTLRRSHKATLNEDVNSIKEYCLKLIYSGIMPPRVTVFNDFTLDINWYRTLRGAFPHFDGYTEEYYRLAQGWYVPQGYMLPLGDNRDNSRDGRYFGPVKIKKILGNGVIIYWPGRNIESVERPAPLNPPPGKSGLSRIGFIR